VSPYRLSTNEAINGATLDLKSSLDAGPEKFKYGTAMERQAEHAASLDQAWKLLPPVAIAATFSVIEEDPETKLMSRLALTASQRSEILHKLHSLFGDEVSKGIKTGQSALVAAGAVLYEVIGKQARKTRDDK